MGQKYEIMDLIAVGGMAEIYLARALGAQGFQKYVVVKKILPHLIGDSSFVDLLVEEAKVAASLQHGNIVQVHDLRMSSQGDYFIVMDYIAGRDLGFVLKQAKEKKEILPYHEVVYIGRQICAGLDFAHRKTGPGGKPLGIIHRDISPENVILSFDGEVKIIDFGIAKAANRSTHTQVGYLKGKYGYMSPEQAGLRALDHRTDIFNVGIVLYELLVGEALFTGTSKRSVLQRMRAPRRFHLEGLARRGLPERLTDIVTKALSERREDRYQSAGEMERELTFFAVESGKVATAEDLARRMAKLFGAEPPLPEAQAPIAQLNLDTVEGGMLEGRDLEVQPAARSSTRELGEGAINPNADLEELVFPPAYGSSAAGEESDLGKEEGHGRRRVPTEDMPPTFVSPKARAKNRGDARELVDIEEFREPKNVDLDPRVTKKKSRGKILALSCFCCFFVAALMVWPWDMQGRAWRRTENSAAYEEDFSAHSFSAPKQFLFLKTEPPGARAVVNGREIDGRTPLLVPLDLDDDKRAEITFVSRMHQTLKETLEFEEGQRVLEFNPQLVPKLSNIRIRTLPSGAKILIDGEEKGASAMVVKEIPYGSRRISLVAPGHLLWERDLDVRRRSHRLTVHLVPEAEASFLELMTWPDVEAVFMGGVRVPIKDVPVRIPLKPGTHRVYLKSSFGFDKEINLRTEEGETRRLFVDFFSQR